MKRLMLLNKKFSAAREFIIIKNNGYQIAKVIFLLS